jgi:tRNA modification GTPase
LPALLAALEKEAATRMGGDDAPLLTRARHRAALEDCVAALDRALAGGAAELVAEDMRLAARSLGRITGRVGVEDILDIIFREFCIGK